MSLDRRAPGSGRRPRTDSERIATLVRRHGPMRTGDLVAVLAYRHGGKLHAEDAIRLAVIVGTVRVDGDGIVRLRETTA